jgi:3-deoxy-D-manno-octulosonic-acid transferase
MRFLYSIIFYLATPFILLHFLLRGIKDRGYLGRWRERFAWYPSGSQQAGIVIHAASVGELNAALPLIRSLLEKTGAAPLTVTSFTPTGSARVQVLFGERVSHVYIPLDLPGAVKRFYEFSNPKLLIIMETEIWPNLFHQAKRRNIPILMANARLSPASLGGYRRFASLVRGTLSSVDHVAAQSRADADRLIDCGALEHRVFEAGNLKYDIAIPDGLAEKAVALRKHWGEDRPVLIAASTHPEDDEVILGSLGRIREQVPGLLLILVPRHPERFTPTARMATDLGFRTDLFSDGPACSPQTECFVIDAMGELLNYYACSDLAVLGGSFGPVGGHNALEASALSVPVIVGPNTWNFTEITDDLIHAGAALRANNADELAGIAANLLLDREKRSEMGRCGLQLVRQGRGALQHTLSVIDDLLEQPCRS